MASMIMAWDKLMTLGLYARNADLQVLLRHMIREKDWS